MKNFFVFGILFLSFLLHADTPKFHCYTRPGLPLNTYTTGYRTCEGKSAITQAKEKLCMEYVGCVPLTPDIISTIEAQAEALKDAKVETKFAKMSEEEIDRYLNAYATSSGRDPSSLSLLVCPEKPQGGCPEVKACQGDLYYEGKLGSSYKQDSGRLPTENGAVR